MLMGDDAEIAQEWVMRIMCAVEGIQFDNCKHLYFH